MYTNRKNAVKRARWGQRSLRYLSILLLCSILLGSFAVTADDTDDVADSFTVTFYFNDNQTAEVYHQETVPDGAYITEPDPPTRRGYLFTGWSINPTEDLPFDWDTPITEPLSLFAIWTLDESEEEEEDPEEEEEEPEEPTDQIREHHAFLIGDPEGRILPRDNISRAEAATIFFRLITDEHRTDIWTQTNPFPDVTLSNWFNNAVSTMTSDGLFYGLPDGSFGPQQTLTRAQLATIMVRFQDLTEEEFDLDEDRFTDISGHWAEAEINIAAHQRWVQGVGDNRFAPNAMVSRAEAAAMISRMLGRPAPSIEQLHPDMLTWPDNPPGGYQHRPTLNDPGLVFAGDLTRRLETTSIVLHHLHADASIRNIHQGHLNQGWLGFAYHFQVDKDGSIWLGRPLDTVGAHTAGHNVNTIGVVVRGRYDTVDTTMPNAQYNALVELLRYIQSLYGAVQPLSVHSCVKPQQESGRPLDIFGHRDLTATACPGRFFPMEEVRRGQYRGNHKETFAYVPATWYYLYIQEAGNSYRYLRTADGDYETWLELLPPRNWAVLDRPESEPWHIYR